MYYHSNMIANVWLQIISLKSNTWNSKVKYEIIERLRAKLLLNGKTSNRIIKMVESPIHKKKRIVQETRVHILVEKDKF